MRLSKPRASAGARRAATTMPTTAKRPRKLSNGGRVRRRDAFDFHAHDANVLQSDKPTTKHRSRSRNDTPLGAALAPGTGILPVPISKVPAPLDRVARSLNSARRRRAPFFRKSAKPLDRQ